MRRAAVALLVIAIAMPAAAEKWYEAYNKGVNAVRAKNYAAGADLLESAIAQAPMENNAARVDNNIFTYVPHFWLGIAKFNLGEIDNAVREWHTSEEQGAIQNTIYYSQLREWFAQAKEAKQRNAENAAASSKKDANAAVGRAVSAQMDAVSAGGDRSDSYRAAQRKLQEAVETFNKAGVDIHAYKHANDLALQARDLFASAADAARKQRAARPVPQPQQPKPQPAVVVPKPQPQPPTPKVEEKPAPVVSETLVAARIAVQEYRRRLVDLHLQTLDAERLDGELAGNPDAKVIARVTAQVAERQRELDKRAEQTAAKTAVADVRPELVSAYRAFAAGDFTTSESMLTRILDAHANAEAYLLRGCARYTRAMLSRRPDALLASAKNDFRAALKLNGALRLDASFSPKLVKFFDSCR